MPLRRLHRFVGRRMLLRRRRRPDAERHHHRSISDKKIQTHGLCVRGEAAQGLTPSSEPRRRRPAAAGATARQRMVLGARCDFDPAIS
jgi:hypothetical protein